MKLDKVMFQIKHIEILEFSFKHPNRAFPENSPFRFDMQTGLNVNTEEDRITVNSKFKIYYDNEKEHMATANISCVYHVTNLSQLISESENKKLLNEIITSLNSISLSTCRGIIFTLFRGTPLHSVILPIVNPQIQD